jgi:excisionase family DNA binding protein
VQPPRELFTASQVADFCTVDLKTIHNWADRGELRHFRTPGRHLRFRRGDVAEFLRKYGYPVHAALIAGRLRVHILDADGAMLATLKRKLAKDFDITTFQDPIDALVAIGFDLPDGIVLDVGADTFDGMRFISRVKRFPATRDIRTVVFCARAALKQKALEAGAASFVAKPDVDGLGDALSELLRGNAA